MSETEARAVWVEFYEEDPDSGKIDHADMANSMSYEIAKLRNTVIRLRKELSRTSGRPV